MFFFFGNFPFKDKAKLGGEGSVLHLYFIGMIGNTDISLIMHENKKKSLNLGTLKIVKSLLT